MDARSAHSPASRGLNLHTWELVESHDPEGAAPSFAPACGSEAANRWELGSGYLPKSNHND